MCMQYNHWVLQTSCRLDTNGPFNLTQVSLAPFKKFIDQDWRTIIKKNILMIVSLVVDLSHMFSQASLSDRWQ